MGSMTYGYCGQAETWAATLRGHALLNRVLPSRGIQGHRHRVCAGRGQMPDGRLIVLPHNCDIIPDHVLDAYVHEIQAARNKHT
jgi:hypothetical protein